MGYLEKLLAETSYKANLTAAIRRYVNADVSIVINDDTDTLSVKIDNGITKPYFYTFYSFSNKLLYGYNHYKDALIVVNSYQKFIFKKFFKKR